MAELILYAVPVGALAEQLATCFDGLATEAQRYPPHCTLTGFFHDDDVARYVDAGAIVAAPCSISIAGPCANASWIGLELTSDDLLALTERFADAMCEPGTRRDAIRPKSWLHVSIAYGHAAVEHEALTARAMRVVDPDASCEWELRLYERCADDTWTVHGRWPLPAR